MEAPTLPDGVLLQSVYVDAEGEESGWRVWADGRHEGRRAGEGWIAAPPIDAGGLDAIATILGDADLAAMDGVHRPDARTQHGSVLWFQVARPDGAPVTVGLVGGASLPALDSLVARLAPVLSGGAAP